MAYSRYKSYTVTFKPAVKPVPAHLFTVHFMNGDKMTRTFDDSRNASEFMSRMKRNGHFRNRAIKRIDWDRA